MAHDAYPSRGGSSTRDGRAAEGFVGSPLLSPFFMSGRRGRQKCAKYASKRRLYSLFFGGRFPLAVCCR